MTENGVKHIKFSLSSGIKWRKAERFSQTFKHTLKAAELIVPHFSYNVSKKKKTYSSTNIVQNNCVFATVATSKCTPGPPYGTPLVAAVVAAPIQNE